MLELFVDQNLKTEVGNIDYHYLIFGSNVGKNHHIVLTFTGHTVHPLGHPLYTRGKKREGSNFMLKLDSQACALIPCEQTSQEGITMAISSVSFFKIK